ncbi:MAG: zinc ribbon domain-containing protein [Desulfovermiculus sp.]|nr:zinc ribbon domain-containing protein [Desulfovermiculus sp.]
MDCPHCGAQNVPSIDRCPACGQEVRHDRIMQNEQKRQILTEAYKNPANGYLEEVDSLVFIWTLLFGPIYFAVKGVWRHVVASFLIAVLTFGVSWFIYPFFAKSILRTHYLRMGWVKASGIPQRIIADQDT